MAIYFSRTALSVILILLTISYGVSQRGNCENKYPFQNKPMGFFETSQNLTDTTIISNNEIIFDSDHTYKSGKGKSKIKGKVYDLRQYWGYNEQFDIYRFYPVLEPFGELNCVKMECPEWRTYRVCIIGDIVLYGMVECNENKGKKSYTWNIEFGGDIYISKGLEGDIHLGSWKNLMLLIEDNNVLHSKIQSMNLPEAEFIRSPSSVNKFDLFMAILLEYNQ
jgi:hypothetical protein